MNDRLNVQRSTPKKKFQLKEGNTIVTPLDAATDPELHVGRFPNSPREL